jgi:hypothetical protein
MKWKLFLSLCFLLSLVSCEDQGCQGLIKNIEKNAFNKKCLEGNYTEGMTVPGADNGSGASGGGTGSGGGSGSEAKWDESNWDQANWAN